MRRLLLWTLFIWVWNSTVLLAQFTLTSPQSRVVYQRNQANQGTVWVAGQAPPNTSRIEARLVPVTAGQGSPTAWTPITISPEKVFGGTVPGLGGWYRVEVQALADNNVVATGSVDRVGIGEVFVVSGQSNAFGSDDSNGSVDDRVSCLDFKDDNLNEQLLPVRFSHADRGRSIGPSNPLHIWGILGDKLASRLNVPILFLGAAQPGTTSEQWRQSADASPDYAATLFPYRRLGASLLHYASRTGLRAVLWHQGEGDVGANPQRYFDNVQVLINKSRQQSNYGALAWVVSRATYRLGQSDGNIINAQNRLINEVPNVFAGPSTDQLLGPENRPDDVHFAGTGLLRLTDLWDQSLTSDFFGRSSPMSPTGERPAITTGHVLPASRNAGETIYVPYVKSGPFLGGNQFTVQLLRADGSLVGTLGSGNANPLSVTLPGNVSPGGYRTRVVSTQPTFVGTPSDVFQVGNGPVSTPDPTTPIQPPVNGGTPDSGIRQVGYKYDAVSHGFQLLVDASGPVEVRLERLDGSFGETNWGGATTSSDYSGFNYYRFYAPIAGGVGGVEAGRYRLSVRKAGNGSTGQWTDVNLLNGKFTIYTAGDTAPPTTPPTEPATPTPPAPPAPTPPPTEPTAPTTPPVSPGPADAAIRTIGYKYDAVSHGFQLLANASVPVEMKLERLDGPFAETNWGNSLTSTDYNGYTTYRFYSPASVGVGGVEAGRYRLSVRKTGDTGTGITAEVTLQNGTFTVDGTTSPPTTPPPTTTPPVSISPTDAGIRKIGYKYDAVSHGFQLLADVSVPVEMKLERLDGPFAETNWGNSLTSTDYSGYTTYRFYSPASVGVGGVEAGRYRLSVRKTGDTGTGITADVTLKNGIYQVYSPNARLAAPPDEKTRQSGDVAWRVWPNPFVDAVTVSLPMPIPADRLRVILMNSNGFRQEVAKDQLQIDQSTLRVQIDSKYGAFYLMQVLYDQRPLCTLKLIRQP